MLTISKIFKRNRKASGLHVSDYFGKKNFFKMLVTLITS